VKRRIRAAAAIGLSVCCGPTAALALQIHEPDAFLLPNLRAQSSLPKTGPIVIVCKGMVTEHAYSMDELWDGYNASIVGVDMMIASTIASTSLFSENWSANWLYIRFKNGCGTQIQFRDRNLREAYFLEGGKRWRLDYYYEDDKVYFYEKDKSRLISAAPITANDGVLN
jgi:hypothetical protein